MLVRRAPWAIVLIFTAALVAVALPALPVQAAPALAIATNGVSFTDPAPGGNNNGTVDAGETIQLTVMLTNTGNATATNVQGNLATTTSGVSVTGATASYADIAPSGTASNTVAFVFKTNRSFVCGTPIAFTLTVSFAGGAPTPLTLTVATGGALGSSVTTSYTGPPVFIPDNTTVTAPLTVTQTGRVGKIVFSFDGSACTAGTGATTVGLDHTFVGDLRIALIDPDGTTVTIINQAGGALNAGQNFCQTVLDDSATASIQGVTAAQNPFTGTWKPNSPLAAFNGHTINGTWTLRVSDLATGDTGNIRAWSLKIVPVTCATPPAPTATNDTYSTGAGTPLTVAAPGILANDVSPSGAPLAASQVTGPAHSSSFSLNADGSFSYTSAAGYAGPDSFTYTTGDGTASSTAATVNISVVGKPTANTQSVTVAQGIAKAITLTGSDPNAPPLSLTYTVTANPAHGTLSGTVPNLTYTPNAGYFGPDAFQFKVNNGTLDSDIATVSLAVIGEPTANNQSVTTNQDTAKAVTLTAFDPNSPPPSLTYTVTANPTHGALSGTAPNLTYTPTPGYFGPDSFQFKVNNGTLDSNVATVSITVVGKPTANAQSLTTQQDTPKAITLTGSDPNAPPRTLSFTIAANPTHGTLSGSAPNLIYTPNTGYLGADSFTFKVNNGALDSDVATVSLAVTARPADHFVVSAPASATAGTAFSFTVIAQDAGNQTVTSYSGTVTLSSTDPHAVFPANNVTLINGVGTFSATLNTAGNQTITATDSANANLKGTSVTIAVGSATVTKVTVASDTTVKIGEEAQLTAMATFSNSTTQDVTATATWTSSNDAIATVSSTGKVTGNAPGTATITATVNGVAGSVTVTVTTPTPLGVAPAPAPANRPGSTGAGTPPSSSPVATPNPVPTPRGGQ